LAHLHSANRRILIGVEIVRAPVVREAEIAIQLRRTETSAEADVEAGNESGRGDGGMPRVAEVDHLLRRCRRYNALEVAPHHYSWRHAYVRRLRGRGTAVTRAVLHGRRPALGRHVLHDHQSDAGIEQSRG